VEAQALRQRRVFSWRRFAVGAAVFLVLAVIGTAVGVFVWLHEYAPFTVGSFAGSNPPDGVMVQPPAGSEGVSVFFPRYRENGTFRVETSVRNRGRFAVTILGLPKKVDRGTFAALRPVSVEARLPSGRPYHGRPVDAEHPIRVRPDEEQELYVVYRFMWRCLGGQPAHFWRTGVPATNVSGFRGLPLRIKYAHVFEKTQTVPMPFAITYVCRDEIAAPAPGYVSG
jgi:hypothetical protein